MFKWFFFIVGFLMLSVSGEANTGATGFLFGLLLMLVSGYFIIKKTAFFRRFMHNRSN